MKKILIYSSIILSSLSLGAMEEDVKKRKVVAPRPPALAMPAFSPTDEEMAFIDAAGRGNIAEVKKILTNRPQSFNINAFIEDRDWYQGSALTSAAYEGHTEIVKLLLENGADPNILGEADDGVGTIITATALHLAAAKNNNEIAKLLIEHGAEVNVVGSVVNEKPDSTPLHYATARGNTELVKLLLAHGAKVNCIDSHDHVPLHYACEEVLFEIFKELFNHGALVTKEDINGRWELPLDSTLGLFGKPGGSHKLNKDEKKNCTKIVQKLLEFHKPTYGKHVISESSLICAARENLLEALELLLENCPDININARGIPNSEIDALTALEAALSYGSDECALRLLENGVQWAVEGFLKRNGEGVRYSNLIPIPNLAFAAVYGGCTKALAHFIEHDINLDAKLDKWSHNYSPRENLSLQEFAKLLGSTEASKILHRAKLRKNSIEPRERIKTALLVFNRLMKEEKIPNLPKDVIREILSYLIDDVIAGSAYTEELVPDYKYLKETIIKRFTPKDKKKTLRIPRVSKENLLKALGLEDEGNEPLDPSNP